MKTWFGRESDNVRLVRSLLFGDDVAGRTSAYFRSTTSVRLLCSVFRRVPFVDR
jgi:hypothetical protein